MNTGEALTQAARDLQVAHPHLTATRAYKLALENDPDLARRHYKGDPGAAPPPKVTEPALVDPGAALMQLAAANGVDFAAACRMAPNLAAAWHEGRAVAPAEAPATGAEAPGVVTVRFRAAPVQPAQVGAAGALNGVTLFRAGRWNGRDYSTRSLDDMVNAYPSQGFKAPLKIGHSDAQELAHGYIANLRRDGDKLVGDIVGIPAETMAMIREGRLLTLSAEVYFNLERGDRKFPHALRAVAFLGTSPPGVSGLPLLADHLGDGE